MNCQACNGETKKFGKDRNGLQRYRCLSCGKTVLEPHERPLGEMRLPVEKALSVLQHLVEGCSVRTTERITGVEKRTILSLLAVVGHRCEKLRLERIKNLVVKDVQCDEIWGYVGKKEKTKTRQKDTRDGIGDAWAFIAMERHTKLILAWHLGRRTMEDTEEFTQKLAYATQGNFQVTTDGFVAYRDAVVSSLRVQKVDFAQLVKIYAANPEKETRYSPAVCTGAKKIVVFGNPDMDKVSTSHVERQNLTVRMSMRRMTRLTNAFSKKWINLKYAYALQFTYYNFCRIHSSLRVTPAMESKITDHVWDLRELF
ncbi:MAG: IS1/IS1595 family N-terminal zinc-binding domain-containing protein [Candidatus Binatia bacterium]